MARIDDNDRDDAMLESFFAAGRTGAPVPSARLLDGIMAGADAELAARGRSAHPARRKRRGLTAALAAVIGGWPALASMATAAAAGVWIGAAQPAALTTLTGGVFDAGTTQYELEELMPGYAALATFDEGLGQ